MTIVRPAAASRATCSTTSGSAEQCSSTKPDLVAGQLEQVDLAQDAGRHAEQHGPAVAEPLDAELDHRGQERGRARAVVVAGGVAPEAGMQVQLVGEDLAVSVDDRLAGDEDGRRRRSGAGEGGRER